MRDFMWIETSRKFPEKDGRYLCIHELFGTFRIKILMFVKSIENQDYCYDDSYWGKKNVFIVDGGEDFDFAAEKVPYWMPLPEIPKKLLQ
jgi:hypothetical protein